MTIWFMHDNHTFSKVGELHDTDREAMVQRAYKLFQDDHCGMLCATFGDSEHLRTVLHGRLYVGATPTQIDEFFDSIDEEVNWIARG